MSTSREEPGWHRPVTLTAGCGRSSRPGGIAVSPQGEHQLRVFPSLFGALGYPGPPDLSTEVEYSTLAEACLSGKRATFRSIITTAVSGKGRTEPLLCTSGSRQCSDYWRDSSCPVYLTHWWRRSCVRPAFVSRFTLVTLPRPLCVQCGPEASISGKDIDSLPDRTSPGQIRLH